MLMPVTAWGVKLMSIGMFAGSDRAILWRGPRLQRSLEQFLADVWWGEPDVLILDLAPGTGDMAISVAQALPNAELVVVTTPQPSASDIAVRSGLVALQVPMRVRGVVENMSYFDHAGERLDIFGTGGGARVSSQLTDALHYEVPLMAQLPLDPRIREIGESEDDRPCSTTTARSVMTTLVVPSNIWPRVFWHSKLACGQRGIATLPTCHRLIRMSNHCTSPVASKVSNCCSSMIGMPNSSAFVAFEPGLAPTTAIRLPAHRSGGLAATAFDGLLGRFAGEMLKGAGDHHTLALQGLRKPFVMRAHAHPGGFPRL